MLTPRQRTLLLFISNRIKTTGSAPSFDEMRSSLGLHSKSGVHRMVAALEERGFISRRARRARAIELIREVPGIGPAALSVVPDAGLVARDAPIAFPQSAIARPARSGGTFIPLYGAIAAGRPCEAVTEDHMSVEVPSAMLGAGPHYAVKVSGDSMTGDCIMDGDVAVVRRSEDVLEGRILVVLVAGAEVALKRLKLRGPMAVLESSNPSYPPRSLPASGVRVQGVLVGVIRTL